MALPCESISCTEEEHLAINERNSGQQSGVFYCSGISGIRSETIRSNTGVIQLVQTTTVTSTVSDGHEIFQTECVVMGGVFVWPCGMIDNIQKSKHNILEKNSKS